MVSHGDSHSPVLPRQDVGGADRAMDASLTSLALTEPTSALILSSDANNVRTAANCEPMQTNAISSENTIKHSPIKLFVIVVLGAPTVEEPDQVPQPARG